MMRRNCLSSGFKTPPTHNVSMRRFTSNNPTTPHASSFISFSSDADVVCGATNQENYDGDVQAPMLPTSSRRLPSHRALSYAAGVAVRGGRGGHIRGASRLPTTPTSSGSHSHPNRNEDPLTAALSGFLRAQSETLMRRCLRVILFELGRARYSVHRVPAMGEASTNGDLWIQVIQRASYFHIRGMTFQLDGGGSGSSGGGEQQIGMVEVVLMLYRHLGEIRAQIALPSSFGGPSGDHVPMEFLDDPVFTGKLLSTVVTVLSVQPPSDNRDPSSPWRFLLDNLLAVFPGVSPVAIQQAILFPDERLPATVVNWFLQLVESPTGTVAVLPTDLSLEKTRCSQLGGAPVDPHLVKIQEAIQRDALRQKVSEHGALASISEWLKSRRRGGQAPIVVDTPTPLPDLTFSHNRNAQSQHETSVTPPPKSPPVSNNRKCSLKLKPEECMIVLDQMVGVIAALSHQYRENSWIRQLLRVEEGRSQLHEESSSSPSSGRLSPVAPQVVGAGAFSPLFVVLETAMASRLRSPSRYLQCDPLCGEALLQAYFLPAAAVLASNDRLSNSHHHHQYVTPLPISPSPQKNVSEHLNRLSLEDDLRGVHLARLSFILYRYTGLLSKNASTSTSPSSALTAEVERSPLVEVLLCAAIKTAFQDTLSLSGGGHIQSADGNVNSPLIHCEQKPKQSSSFHAVVDDVEATVQFLAGRLTKQHSALALYEELRMAVATDVRVAMVKTILTGIQEQWGALRRVVEQHPSVVVLTSRHIVPPEDIPTSSFPNHNNTSSSLTSSSIAARCDRFIEELFIRVMAAVVEGLLYEGLRPLWRAAGNSSKTTCQNPPSLSPNQHQNSNLPPTAASASQLSDLLCSAATLFGTIRPVDGLTQFLSSTAINKNRWVTPEVAGVCGEVCSLQQKKTAPTTVVSSPTTGSHHVRQQDHHREEVSGKESSSLVVFLTNCPDVLMARLLLPLSKRGEALFSSEQPSPSASASGTVPRWASNTLQLIWLSTALQQQQPVCTTTSTPLTKVAMPSGQDTYFSSLRALEAALFLYSSGRRSIHPAATVEDTLNPTSAALTACCYMDVVRYLPLSGVVGGLRLEGLGKLCQGLLFEMDAASHSKCQGVEGSSGGTRRPNANSTIAAMAGTILPVLLGSQRTVQQVPGDGPGDGLTHYYDAVCELLWRCASVILAPASVVAVTATTTTNNNKKSVTIVTSSAVAAAYELCEAVNRHANRASGDGVIASSFSCSLQDVIHAVLNTKATPDNMKLDEVLQPQVVIFTYSAACAVRGGEEGRRALVASEENSKTTGIQVAAPTLPPPLKAASPTAASLPALSSLPLAERHQVVSILSPTATLLTPSLISSSTSVLLPYLLNRLQRRTNIKDTAIEGVGDQRTREGVSKGLAIRASPLPSAAATGAAALLRGSSLSSSVGGASSAAATLLQRGSMTKKTGSGGGLAALSGRRQ